MDDAAASLTADSVIDLLGGTKAVADALGLADPTVSGWRQPERGIPPGRWAALVALARDRQVSGITFEALASLAARVPEEARAG